MPSLISGPSLPVPGLPVPSLPVPSLPGVGDIAGGLAKASATAVLDGLGTWMAKGTADLLGSLIQAIDRHTEPNLQNPWFVSHYASMAGVAALLALPLLFAAVITAIARQDPSALARAVLVSLPIAAIGTAIAVELVGLGLSATDALCAMVTGSTGSDAATVLSHLAAAITATAPATNGFGLVLVCLIVAFGAFLLAIELVVRSAAVYVAVLFLPVALAGLIWPSTARWSRRLAEMLSVLILSKFVIVAVLSMAIGAFGAGLDGGGLSGLLTGAALLLLAASGPFALLRMVPIVEAGAVHHLDGTGRKLAATPVTAPLAVDSTRRQVESLLQRGGGGSGGGDSSGIGASGGEARPIGADGLVGNGNGNGAAAAESPTPAASTAPAASAAPTASAASAASAGSAAAAAPAATTAAAAPVAAPAAAAAAAASQVRARLHDAAPPKPPAAP